jgi:predicted ABC-type ATPase
MKHLFENWRKYLEEQEAEGRPKAIFMAGSPGSGKSTVLKGLGLLGVNIINADDHYEKELKKAGLPLGGKPEIMKRRRKLQAELEELEPGSEAAIEKQAEIEGTSREFSAYSKLFNSALAYKSASYKKFLDAGENFIVDGTAGNRREMISKKAELEEAGYDVGMILLDLDLETAIARNKIRGSTGGRELLNRELEASHGAVAKNIDFYKQLFGDNFFYVEAAEDKIQSSIANIRPKVQEFFAAESLDENDYPITSKRANKQINRIISPAKKKNTLIKLPGWKRAKAGYRGSAPPGSGGS